MYASSGGAATGPDEDRRIHPSPISISEGNGAVKGSCSYLVEAMCPICGKVYNITDSGNRWGVEGLFLKHKDNCTIPEPGEFIRVVSTVVRVLSVYVDSEEFPLVEVLYASGRRGLYRLSTIGRVLDQGDAAERFRRMGGDMEE